MTPGAGIRVLGCTHISRTLEMHYFFKHLLYSHVYIRQTKYIVMMTKEGSTKIVNFMTHGAGFFLLGRGHISHIVKIYYFLRTLLYSQAQIRQIMYIVIITKEGFTEIVNFMTPGAGVRVLGCGHLSDIVKMHYFFQNLLLYSQAQVKQAKYIVMITKEGSTKIVITPGAGVLMLGHGHISHYSDYVVQYSQRGSRTSQRPQWRCYNPSRVALPRGFIAWRSAVDYLGQVNYLYNDPN